MKTQKILSRIGSILVLSLFLTIAISATTTFALNWVEDQQFWGSDIIANDYFGQSVAVDGSFAVIGAPGHGSAGAAYVFEFDSGRWRQVAKLEPASPSGSENFGHSVAIDGDVIVVGAYHAIISGTASAGAAYVFEYDGDNWPTTETQKLTASDYLAGDWLGFSVAVSGDYVIASALGDDDNGLESGSAYIYEKSGTWPATETKRIEASDGAEDDNFGSVVGISGNYAIVGAVGDNSFQGSAYIYERSGTWPTTETQKIVASDGAADDMFSGESKIAIEGTTAVIGANKFSSPGAAYIFERVTGTWTQQQMITPGDSATNDGFGTSVDISGTKIIVGKPNESTNTGSAYIFEDTGTWVEQEELTASNGTTYDYYGYSVGASGDHVIVGAYGEDTEAGYAGSFYTVAEIPEATSVQQTSTSGNFEYGDDLTASGTPSTGSHTKTNWEIDGVSMAVANLTFDGGLGSEDLTTSDLSGTLSDGTVSWNNDWFPSGGHDGYGTYDIYGMSNDRIEFADHADLDGFNEMTLSLWIHPRNSLMTSFNGIVCKADASEASGSTNSWALSRSDDAGDEDKIRFKVYGSGGSTSDSFYTSDTIDGGSYIGEWNHLAITWNGYSKEAQIYKNGVAQGSVQSGTNVSQINASTAPLWIGDCFSSIANFRGYVDDVLIFPTALHADEIAALYSDYNDVVDSEEVFPSKGWKACVTPFNDATGTDGTEVCTSEETISWDGISAQTLTSDSGYFIDGDDLTANYTINDGTHGMVNWKKDSTTITAINLPMDGENGDENTQSTDISGNINDVTILNGAEWDGTGDNDSYGMYDLNTNGDYLYIPDSNSLDITGAMSIEFWMNIVNPSANSTIVTKYDSGAGKRAYSVGTNGTHCNGAEIEFTLSSQGGTFDGGVLCSNNVLTSGWHHIVATYTPSTSMKIFIDGSDESRAFGYGSGPPASIAINDLGLGIGGAYTSSTYPDDNWFNGKIDRVRIYTQDLTAEQVASLYTNDLDIITAEETTIGDFWLAEIYAFDNTNTGAQSPGEETGEAEILDDAPAAIIPEFSTWLLILTMLIGMGLIYNKREGIITNS
ncbi:LamG-like jellyroll fold domain-containing protein [Patescibacteria group bacterium]